MAFALVAHTKITPAANGGTTPSVNTTGATLLVMVVSRYQFDAAGTPSDNKGNTWVGLTESTAGNINAACRIFYVKNPTVGSGHTFTYSGTGVFCSMYAQAFSGSNTSANADQQNGAVIGPAAGAASLATGSVTPSENNELVVTGLCQTQGASATINSSFIITDQDDYVSGLNEGGGAAYKIQTTAAAVNPTWSWSAGASDVAVTIATFKALAATTFNQTVSASCSSVSTLSRSVNKSLSFSCTPVSKIVRSVGKLLSTISVTSVSSLVKRTGKILSVSTTSTSTLRRQTGKLLSLANVSVSSLSRQCGKVVPLSVSSISSVAKQITKVFSVNVSSTSTDTRTTGKLLSVDVSNTSTVTRSIGKQEVVNVASTSSMVRNIGKVLSLSVASVSSVVKQIGKVILSTVSQVVTLLVTSVFPFPYRKVTVYGRDDTRPTVIGMTSTQVTIYGRNDTTPQVTGVSTTHLTVYGRNDTLNNVGGE